MIGGRRTVAICANTTRAGRCSLAHIRPQTSIGVMLGDDPAKRRKIATSCAKRLAGRDLLKGPVEVQNAGLTGRLSM